MQEFEAQDELQALATLGKHERELDLQLENARLEGERVVAEARRSAERLTQEAKPRLREELDALRTQQASELEHALAVVQEQTRRSSESLRRTAEHNRERALAWILSRVAGRDTS